CASTAAAEGTHRAPAAGYVYTLTNSPTDNQVVTFARGTDGSLVQVGATSTDGTGTGAGLGSQGALALDGDRLFAVNAAGTANIAGFRVGPHDLLPLAHSTRQLSPGASAPAQVAFTPDGSRLVVTEKASNTIDTFRVTLRHVGTAVSSPSVGATPFGFDFDARGNLLVSNADGSASSYAIDRRGGADVISGAVATGNAAPCWLVATPNGRFAYTANGGSGTLSGFTIGRDG